MGIDGPEAPASACNLGRAEPHVLSGTFDAWTLLQTLAVGPATADQLADLLPIARPRVSRHLCVLREVGLVEVRQDAQRQVYSLCPEPLAEVHAWLSQSRALWEHRLGALHTEVD